MTKIWLGSIHDGSSDGSLVVSLDEGATFFSPPGGQTSLLQALQDWSAFEHALVGIAPSGGVPRRDLSLGPVLPRTFQALYGSAYGNRAIRVAQSNDADAETADILMYQGSSDHFLGPGDELKASCLDTELDLEAEVAVIVGPVPMGAGFEKAKSAIRLVTGLNDFSYRGLIRQERSLGFGFVRGKPLSALAELAVSPEALGAAWRGSALDAIVEVIVNDEVLGVVPTRGMSPNFAQLIVHAATIRPLAAGTIVSSGTVSAAAGKGAASLIELRAQERSRQMPPRDFLKSGDSVALRYRDSDGRNLFGRLANTIR